jgi:hypothetical protein
MARKSDTTNISVLTSGCFRHFYHGTQTANAPDTDYLTDVFVDVDVLLLQLLLQLPW